MMAEKTRAELAKENSELRKRLRTQERRIARLEGDSTSRSKHSPPPGPPAPARPSASEPTGSDAAKIEQEIRHWTSIFVHELNQPLSAILTTAQACVRLTETGTTVRPRVKPHEIAEALGSLARQASYAGSLVRRLRDWAIDAPMHRESVDLEAVVGQSAELLEEPLREAGVKLRIEPNSRPLRVWGDPVQLQQVIVNLVRNAIEAMQETPAKDRLLIVRLFEEQDPREPGYSVPDATAAAPPVAGGVAVIDRGPGLSLAVIDRLFSPLVSTKPQGMGLGLAISRRLVEAHGGRLWGETNPQGCVFRFTIPGELPTP
jgi:two-component system, LuxR family, sensor kinase FixL